MLYLYLCSPYLCCTHFICAVSVLDCAVSVPDLYPACAVSVHKTCKLHLSDSQKYNIPVNACPQNSKVMHMVPHLALSSTALSPVSVRVTVLSGREVLNLRRSPS